MAHLDYREKGGYERVNVNFFPKEASLESWQLTLYLGKDFTH